jgi:hypothetical protein
MKIAMILCALLAFPLSSFAEEGHEAGWNPLSAGPITTWTAPMVGKGVLVVQPIAIYTKTRGSFNDDGNYEALPSGDKKSQIQQQFFAQYGITDKWEFDAQIVFQENYITSGGSKGHDQGVGDSYIFTRYELFEETERIPEVAGLLQLKIPTGKYQHADPDKQGADLTGTGSWDPGVGILLTKKFKPFVFHADALINAPQSVGIDGVKTQYANYLNYDLAVEYFLPKGFNFMLEANGLYQGNTKQDGVKDPASDVRSLTLSPGIGWSNDCIQTLVSYQRTVSGRNTDANDSLVMTFVYTF